MDFSKSNDFVGNTGDFDFEVVSGKLRCHFFVSLNKGNISNISYKSDLTGGFLGFFHALCKLLSKSELDRVRNFSNRELESFLRDSNQTPSMNEDQFPNEFIELFKNSLLSAYLKNSLENDIADWTIRLGASYIDKVKAIREFLTLRVNMNNYFQEQNIEVNLVHLGDEEAVIEFVSTINSLKLSPNTLTNLEILTMGKLIGTIIGNDQINLVAE